MSEVSSSDCMEIPKAARHVDLKDAIIAPGFIDLHIHGAAGHDIMEAEDSALEAVESLIAKHGVTSYLPTMVTAPMDKTLDALGKLGHFIERMASHGAANNGRARPLGVHLEGPFLSPTKRAGVEWWPVSGTRTRTTARRCEESRRVGTMQRIRSMPCGRSDIATRGCWRRSLRTIV